MRQLLKKITPYGIAALAILLVGGFMLTIVDEAAEWFRGRQNIKGTWVDGFVLY